MNEPPRLFDGEPMLLRGRRERYARADAGQHIPAQWAWFGPRAATILDRVGADTFGVCSESDDTQMTYFCGVRVATDGETPEDLVIVRIPALRYAAIAHQGPVSDVPRTVREAFDEGLPRMALVPLRGPGVPDLVEHYGDDFNAQTGTGTVDLWIPIGTNEQHTGA